MTTASTVLLGERRAWEVVLQSVETRLLSGKLKPGDHLPPERQLAADLGVGRSSVREAIRVLEVLGLIRTATGSGPTSGAIIVATPSGGMSALMRLQVAAHGFAVADVVKTRLVLEAAVAAELAAAHRTAAVHPNPGGTERAADTLGPATQLLDAMDAVGLTEAEFLALDAQFHVALAEASRNQVVAAMMAGLRNSIESYVLAAVPNLSSWAQTSARLRVEHRGILIAIQEGDQADATARVRAHITGYYAESRLTPDAPTPALSPSAPLWSFSAPVSDHSGALGEGTGAKAEADAKTDADADADAETETETETQTETESGTTTRAERPRKEPTHG
jgi:DNA-binding FadR family transcriptional regulator